MNDFAIALWNSAFHMGMIVGPILGSYIVKKVGF
jgi:hypothetical protein